MRVKAFGSCEELFAEETLKTGVRGRHIAGRGRRDEDFDGDGEDARGGEVGPDSGGWWWVVVRSWLPGFTLTGGVVCGSYPVAVACLSPTRQIGRSRCGQNQVMGSRWDKNESCSYTLCET